MGTEITQSIISLHHSTGGIYARIINLTAPSPTCSTALQAHVHVITLTEPLGANGNDNHHMTTGLNHPCGSQNTPLERYLHAMTYCGILNMTQRKTRNAIVKVVFPEERFESVGHKGMSTDMTEQRISICTKFLQV